MSRSDYDDDCEYLELYRASVERALKGRRGQSFLREMAAAMDDMPTKELIADELISEEGACCAIGAVCQKRAIDISRLNYYDPSAVGQAVGICRSMAAEIAYMNDEYGPRNETPPQRWQRMRKWINDNLTVS